MALARVDGEKTRVSVTTLKESEDCSDRVQKGDIVHITHRGMHGETVIDFNDEGEPLKIALGKKQVLAGMEVGLLSLGGQCLGETRSVFIPARLAFDDPTKNFQRKPVPEGADVTYDITVVKIERGGAKATGAAGAAFVRMLPVFAMIGLAGYFAYTKLTEVVEKPESRTRTKAKMKKKGKRS
eukprot:CAMPEP_0205830798 /NCGR_PEP_ID=MMETSP0206-20130828/42164_1 /ASSEMBLY_ACC=CAM_ASM_000279 /TAXON_ID=36767 /ORGANISM="Euplotes focardii, Strain TN1" /LENGTH=182 /DNA_ID=CAMNT_0053134781 /DNA_START=54 /DNA_END=602 /DNA_ORIENTATION=-